MKRGRFIYITGCDGTGKTTQARLLIDQLNSHGEKTRHLWLRFPFFFSSPLLFYARLRGYSWYEVISGYRYGYWDFGDSWLMSYIFPWILYVDASIFAVWQIYLPLFIGVNVVCERFVLDILADLEIAIDQNEIHSSYVGHMFQKLIPKSRIIILLDLDEQIARNRRPDLVSDRKLSARLSAYRDIARDLGLDVLSSELPITEVSRLIYARL
jgi:hypothetical protein